MQAQTVAETKRIKVRDAASCRAWLTTLGENELGRLSAIERLLRNLAHSPQAPDLLLEIAEQARTAHLHELDSMAGSLRGAVFPMPEAERRRLTVVCDGLALGRDLFARLHTQLLDDSEAATRTVIPGTTTTLRAILPLARALDYQARLILCLQFNGFEIEPAHWDKLCAYATRVRASTFQDVPLPTRARCCPRRRRVRCSPIHCWSPWLSSSRAATPNGPWSHAWRAAGQPRWASGSSPARRRTSARTVL